MKLIHLLECHYTEKPRQPPGGSGPALLVLLLDIVRECLTSHSQLGMHNLISVCVVSLHVVQYICVCSVA